jgi:hypothetical protein
MEGDMNTTTTLKRAAVGFTGLLLLTATALAAWSTLSETPVEKAVNDRRAALSEQATRCSEYVQRQLSNPSSFELVDYTTDGMNVLISYRARNGLDAVVTDQASCPLPNGGAK